MDQESGDDYLRRLASFIRTNERGLAEGGFSRRRRGHRPVHSSDSLSLLNPLGWLGLGGPAGGTPNPKPLVFSTDTHHLFYTLMRLEALGYDIGSLDVQIDNPSRPTSYVNLFPAQDKSDTLSLASFRSSLSAVSSLSIGSGWWSRPEVPSVDDALKYIFSSFTKLPALRIHAPEKKVITEIMHERHDTAVPLDSFKNITSLESLDIDPRTLLGWDKLADGLLSLKIRKSGLEDISDIFIGAVLDDQARREGSASRKRRREIPRGLNRQTSFHSTRLPDTVIEDEAEESLQQDPSNTDGIASTTPTSSTKLSNKWAFLKHLALPDNSLTYFPTDVLPLLTSLTHLDLSSNLLVSVPSGLGALYNLISLNLSDNMIDSVLGIYLNLGQVLWLNLSHNRLESICGLERLQGLERVDLRNNLIEESTEVGRLATLPNISAVWVEGNPLVEIEEGYRVNCFDLFLKEGKTIMLDGTAPGFYEKRYLSIAPPEQMTSSRAAAPTTTPPVFAVSHPHTHNHSSAPTPVNDQDKLPTPPSSNPSPHSTPISAVGVGHKKAKKSKRIVDLDGSFSDTNSITTAHSRKRSNAETMNGKKVDFLPHTPVGSHLTIPESKARLLNTMTATGKISPKIQTSPSEPSPVEMYTTTIPSDNPKSPGKRAELGKSRRHRHSRYQTELAPVSISRREDISDPLEDVSQNMKNGSSTGTFEPPSPSSVRKQPQKNSTMLSTKSELRRARLSASMYEPASMIPNEEVERDEIKENADAYRRQIEALKKDMGDGWLKVFRQTQMQMPSSGS